MPIHDWSCPSCQSQIYDVYQPRLVREDMACIKCGAEMERLWSLSSAGRVKFDEFDIHVPDRGMTHISDLHQLRKIEKHCETNASRPFAVRQYSQDQSNRQNNCFGERPNPKFSPRTSRGIPFREMIRTRD